MKHRIFPIAMLCILLCASVAAAVLSACAADRPASASAGKEPTSTPQTDSGVETLPAAQSSVSAEIAAQTDSQTDRLPLENSDYKTAELKNYRTIGAQVFYGESAYPLAEAIYQYRDYHNSLIFTEPFSDIRAADPAMLIEIAASQTPHVNLYDSDFQSASGNPLYEFAAQQQAENRVVWLPCYGSDARAKAKALFGDSYELPRQGGHTVKYNEKLDIYYLDAEGASMVTDYPIITDIQQDGDLYEVSAVILSYWAFANSWSNQECTWESGENVAADSLKSYLTSSAHTLPVFHFTLRNEDGVLRVTGFNRG